MKRSTFKLARNPASGQFEWAPEGHGGPKAWLGWFVLGVSTVLFVIVVVYFVLSLRAAGPRLDLTSLPDSGVSMNDEVHRLGLGEQRASDTVIWLR